jgi:hypothetical protein
VRRTHNITKVTFLKMGLCPSVKSQFDEYTDDRVVINEKMFTNQSPGTAMKLALKLVEILFGVDRTKKLNAGFLALI